MWILGIVLNYSKLITLPNKFLNCNYVCFFHVHFRPDEVIEKACIQCSPEKGKAYGPHQQ